MDTARQILCLFWHEEWQRRGSQARNEINRLGGAEQIADEFLTIVGILEGDMMSVGRDECHRTQATKAHLTVHALSRIVGVLRIELSYHIGALHIVVVEVHEHLIAHTRFIVEAAAFGSDGCGDTYPG